MLRSVSGKAPVQHLTLLAHDVAFDASRMEHRYSVTGTGVTCARTVPALHNFSTLLRQQLPMLSPLGATTRSNDLLAAHPMDSSRLFLSVLGLVRAGEQNLQDQTTSIIAVPVLRRLLSAIHFRDAATLKHSRRVGLISVGIASRLGWDDEELQVIEIAALLHDIGKIGVPDHILRKPGRLNPDEAEYITVHHRGALALLQACGIDTHVTEIIAQSHGIAQGQLTGNIPLALGSRILAVADAYDSLTTRQCYRASFDRWEALQILEEQSGKQFDRNVVAALGRWLDGPDAASLADERSAEVSIQVNAPIDMETRAQAGQLCHLFNHLSVLESLYEAYYIVDESRRVVIWSSGAEALFRRAAPDVMWKKWSRQLVTKTPENTDPLETVFMTGQPICHGMTLQSADGGFRDMDVQSVPIQDDAGAICGVVELVCNGKESKQHRGHFRSLQIAATRDPLTGVLNRGELERSLDEIYQEWKANPGTPFSVIFLDLDHFKSINDRLSHSVGDRVLIDCARLLEDELYSGELVGRYGGEEFVVVCPETTLDAAFDRAERLRRTIMNAQFAERTDLRVTASLGVAQVESGDTVESILECADQALYKSKHEGRNRTTLGNAPSRTGKRDPRHRAHADAQCCHTATIFTCVAVDILPIKLRGFVEEHKARILHVDQSGLEMQVGNAHLLGSWSQSRTEQMPVKVVIKIGKTEMSPETEAPRRLGLQTSVVPVGNVSRRDLFQRRAAYLIEQLRSYLIAD